MIAVDHTGARCIAQPLGLILGAPAGDQLHLGSVIFGQALCEAFALEAHHANQIAAPEAA